MTAVLLSLVVFGMPSHLLGTPVVKLDLPAALVENEAAQVKEDTDAFCMLVNLGRRALQRAEIWTQIEYIASIYPHDEIQSGTQMARDAGRFFKATLRNALDDSVISKLDVKELQRLIKAPDGEVDYAAIAVEARKLKLQMTDAASLMGVMITMRREELRGKGSPVADIEFAACPSVP
ncbi:hypothetical protein HOI83_01480 [Candidatus Uhrbacteria bacterium]|nr:hypothetical protein [Candidatus Uhrbacteria bacterium]